MEDKTEEAKQRIKNFIIEVKALAKKYDVHLEAWNGREEADIEVVDNTDLTIGVPEWFYD